MIRTDKAAYHGKVTGSLSHEAAMSGRVWKIGAIGAVALVALVIIGVAVYSVTTQRRWAAQRVEAASVIQFFCEYNLLVSDTECLNWAYQTVDRAPSTTDGILTCNAVFWNGANSRDQAAFTACLARSGVNIPE